MSEPLRYGLTEEQIAELIHSTVLTERARLGKVLAAYAKSILEDTAGNAQKFRVSKEEQITAKTAVATFASVVLQQFADMPLPEVNVRGVDLVASNGKVH